MAKLSEQVRKLIIADHLTGKFSQRELAKKYDLSTSTINKITKWVEAKNEHLVNAQVALLSARETLPPEQTNAIANAARDEFYNRRLIENATQKT